MRRRVARGHALGTEPLELSHSPEMTSERPREPRRGVAPRLVRPVEDRLRHLEQTAWLTRRPRVGQIKRRCVCHRCNEQLDLGDANRLTLGPRCDLADLVREPVQIVLPDELNEQRAGVRVGLYSRMPKPFRDPGDTNSLGGVVQEHVACLRAQLRERGVLLHLEPDEGQHGSRRGG